ncbi:MAG TPA: phosphatase PAP2 family protein [Acidimicrobiales bacterium]|nr:phosphatase PAP2 family protein [Acidimicrobiales bacterium]
MLERSVDAFDNAVDRWMSPLRGRRLPDAVASSASALGDHGLIWFLLGLVRAHRRGRRRSVAVRAVVFTGLVVPGVNAALKTMVGRVRPEPPDRHVLRVRVPRTASFPSGHTLAAWCAATLFADQDPWWPVYFGAAAVISVSRVHVRLHHATDVVAGALLGTALGTLGKRLFPVPHEVEGRLESSCVWKG